MFSTATVDNIDVAGRIDMHGASITLIGHLTRETWGKTPPPLVMDMPDDSLIELPDDHAVVLYFEDTCGDIFLEPDGVMNQVLDNTQGRVCINEQAWLSHVIDINSKGSMMESGNWMRYQSPTVGSLQEKQVDEIRPRAVIGVFPVFTEEVRYTEHAEAYHACC